MRSVRRRLRASARPSSSATEPETLKPSASVKFTPVFEELAIVTTCSAAGTSTGPVA